MKVISNMVLNIQGVISVKCFYEYELNDLSANTFVENFTDNFKKFAKERLQHFECKKNSIDYKISKYIGEECQIEKDKITAGANEKIQQTLGVQNVLDFNYVSEKNELDSTKLKLFLGSENNNRQSQTKIMKNVTSNQSQTFSAHKAKQTQTPKLFSTDANQFSQILVEKSKSNLPKYVSLKSRKKSETRCQITLADSTNNLSNHQIPVGIYNIRKTSYANAILQVLFHQLEFARQICKYRVDDAKWDSYQSIILDPNYIPSQSEKHGLAVNGCEFIVSLQHLFYQLASRKQAAVSPRDVLSRMVWSDGQPMLEQYKQQDALEFVTSAFELVEAGMTLRRQVRDDSEHFDHGPSGTNPFEGEFRTVVRNCSTGSVLNEQTEKFNHVILSVQHGNLQRALQEALKFRVDGVEHEVGLAWLSRELTCRARASRSKSQA